MKSFVLIATVLFSFASAAQKSDLPVDFSYACQKFVKPAGSGSSEFVQIEERGKDYTLKVGKHTISWPFGLNLGGPWFSLEEIHRGDIMVIGVARCFESYSSTDWVSVHLDCTDDIGANDEGFGYYENGGWLSLTAPRSLPGLYNNNLNLSRGFWQGETEGLITTATLSGYDYVSEDSVTKTRFECHRL